MSIRQSLCYVYSTLRTNILAFHTNLLVEIKKHTVQCSRNLIGVFRAPRTANRKIKTCVRWAHNNWLRVAFYNKQNNNLRETSQVQRLEDFIICLFVSNREYVEKRYRSTHASYFCIKSVATSVHIQSSIHILQERKQVKKPKPNYSNRDEALTGVRDWFCTWTCKHVVVAGNNIKNFIIFEVVLIDRITSHHLVIRS